MSTLKLFAATHPAWFGLALTLAWLALLLVLETVLTSIWWGALVVLGGSIWPVVLLHILGNTIVSLQSLVVPLLEPDSLPYRRLLWFSLPLVALGIGLLVGVLPPRRLNT